MKKTTFYYNIVKELTNYGIQYEEKTGVNGLHLITTINLDEENTSTISMLNDGEKDLYRLVLAKENFVLYTDKVQDIIGILEYKC